MFLYWKKAGCEVSLFLLLAYRYKEIFYQNGKYIKLKPRIYNTNKPQQYIIQALTYNNYILYLKKSIL